jgi:hypothetical protein
MKFYNPFKAHIVQYCDKYFVRKWSLLGWVYKENNLKFIRLDEDPWWHTFALAQRWCAADNLDEAIKIRNQEVVKMKVIHEV